jgi:citrate synthase
METTPQQTQQPVTANSPQGSQQPTGSAQPQAPDQTALLTQALGQVLAPLQGAILGLQQELQSVKQSQTVQSASDEQDKLHKQADLKSLLEELDAPEEDKTDQMTPKQVLDVVGNAMQTAMEANNRLLQQRIDATPKPLEEKIDKLGQAVTALLAARQIDTAKGQYSDWDALKPQTAAVLQRYPGMEMGDAYKLAKMEQLLASGAQQQQQAASEKPTNVVTSSETDPYAIVAARAAAARGDAPRQGVVDYRGILAGAAEKVLSSIQLGT